MYMQKSLALSLRVPPSFRADSIAHYIILHTEEGYKIKVSWDIGMLKVSCCICRGALAPSLRVPPSFQADGIAHYIILHTEEGYKIKVSCCISRAA